MQSTSFEADFIISLPAAVVRRIGYRGSAVVGLLLLMMVAGRLRSIDRGP